MLIAITTISILGITALAWIANRVLTFQICPICAGVSGTWLWLIAAYLFGYPIDLVVPALLMGGSVVGIAYQIEKKLPAFAKATAGKPVESASWRTSLLFKTLFIPAGFIGAYGLLMQWRVTFLAAFIFLLLVSFVFLSPSSKLSSKPRRKWKEKYFLSPTYTSGNIIRTIGSSLTGKQLKILYFLRGKPSSRKETAAAPGGSPLRSRESEASETRSLRREELEKKMKAW